MRQHYTLFICILCVILLTVSCRRAHTRNKGRYAKNETTIRVNQLANTETSSEKEITVFDNQFVPKIIHSKEEILLHRIAYKLSYNIETRQPNWVAWRLTSEHTDGSFPRKGVPYYDESGNAIGIGSFSDETIRGDYFIDMDVPAPRQEHIDWREHPTSIDHGHMCPAADCKWDKGAMNQSFLLTNICPQNHYLNGGDWDQLEKKCRKWAKRYGEIYIVAGPVFVDSLKQCFGKNKIPVPNAFFKVVLCMAETPKSLGFIFPNNSLHHDLKDYVVTIDIVERITGIDFFPSLPDDIEEVVEAKADIKDW